MAAFRALAERNGVEVRPRPIRVGPATTATTEGGNIELLGLIDGGQLAGTGQEPGGNHVLFDDAADGRQQRRHVAPAHPLAATRIEHGFQFLDHERDVTAAPEHRRDHPRQRHRPGIVFGVLGVDENLKWPDPALVVEDVVEGDVNGVVAFRPAHLIGLPFQVFGPVQRLEQPRYRAGIAQVLRCFRDHRAFQR